MFSKNQLLLEVYIRANFKRELKSAMVKYVHFMYKPNLWIICSIVLLW